MSRNRSIRAPGLLASLVGFVVASCGAPESAPTGDVAPGVSKSALDSLFSGESASARAAVNRITAMFVGSLDIPGGATPGAWTRRKVPVLGPSIVDRVDQGAASLRPHVRNTAIRGVRKPADVALPRHAGGFVDVVDRGTGMSLAFRMHGAPNADAETVNGYVVYRGAHEGRPDVVYRVTPEGTEDFVAFWSAPETAEVTYDVDLGVGVAGVRLVGGAFEVLDAAGVPRLRASPPVIVDSAGRGHEAAVAVTGCAVDTNPAAPWTRPPVAPQSRRCTLRVSWDGAPITYPALLDPAWTTTDSMQTSRTDHAAAPLPSGDVLVAGGTTSTGALASAEIYHPATGTWTATMPMSYPRTGLTLTPVTVNGVEMALAAGGSGGPYPSSAELYDPGSGTWSWTTSMTNQRVYHTATKIGNTVMVIGGNGTNPKSVEVYNPANANWFSKDQMTAARAFHTAVWLPTYNKILVAGGSDSTTIHQSAELYDIGSNKWVMANPMIQQRRWHTATLLDSDTVLVTGGGSMGNTLASAELFHVTAGTWTATDSMVASERVNHTTTLLPNGNILVAGGYVPGVAVSSTELFSYNAGVGAFCAAGGMTQGRHHHTATSLQDGKVLVAGGFTATAELYDPNSCASCDDGNACTADVCEPSTKCCSHTITPDVCGNGICAPDESPCSCPQDCVDTDGDGLADVWETQGIDMNCDGVPDLNLPALGANPNHKDIFVQIDYMVYLGGYGVPAHSHMPNISQLSPVLLAYFNAPVSNPDGYPGINLHVQIGNAVLHSNGLKFGPAQPLDGPEIVDFYDIKNLHFDSARSKAFHYVISGHGGDSSQCPAGCIGLARPGAGVMLAGGLGPFNTFTFMHELGHELGLQHGGGDTVNYKPNYLSLMNYLYGTGIPTTNNSLRLDYSRSKLLTLDETCLNESAGVQGSSTDRIKYYRFTENQYTCPSDCGQCACGDGKCMPELCGEDTVSCPQDCKFCAAGTCGDGFCSAACGEPFISGNISPCSADCPDPPHGGQTNPCVCGDGFCEPVCNGQGVELVVANASGPINWNGYGTDDEVCVQVNVNFPEGTKGMDLYGQAAGVYGTLEGHDDWNHLDYAFQCMSGFGQQLAPPPELQNDLNEDELRAARVLLPTLVVPIDVVPGCAANPVVPGGWGTVSVAVLSQAGFDPATLDPAALTFAGASSVGSQLMDLNGDRVAELILEYPMADLLLAPGATEAVLTGTLPSSQAVFGVDLVTVVSSLVDSDRDGVTDPCDLCPGTPPRTPVGSDGCPP